MPITKASSNQILEFIDAHNDWQIKDDKLHREFVFKNFIEAFGFMAQTALIAERNDHHPEWFNVYKTVRVDLTTHEANGITERDFALAKVMNEIASSC